MARYILLSLLFCHSLSLTANPGDAYRNSYSVAISGGGYCDSVEASETTPYIEQETERQENIRELEEAFK